jgi:fibronectin-binding autotransporter adhesin
VELAAGAGGTTTLTFGTLGGLDNNNNARAGCVNFILGAGTKVTTTSANTASGGAGILGNGYGGAGFLLNSNDWAANDGSGLVVAYTGYQVDAVATANAHVDLQTTALTLGANVATIRFNQNASLVLSNTVNRALGNAGILMTANVGANTNIITGAGLLGGISGRGNEIYNYDANPNSALIIDCPIGNQAGAQMTFIGPGLTKITQNAQATAASGIFSLIGGARLEITNNAALGFAADGRAVQFDNGTLILSASFALDNNSGGGLNARPLAIGTHGANIKVSGAFTNVVSGVISGVSGSGSFAKSGPGTLSLTAINTYTGPTFVQGGTLAVSQTPTGTGALVVNDGAAFTYSGGLSYKPISVNLGSVTGATNTFVGVSSTTTAPIATTTLNANGTTVVNASGGFGVGVYPLISFVTRTGSGNFVVGSLPPGIAATIITNNATNIALNVTSAGNPDVWKGNLNNNWNIATTANWFLNNAITYADGDLVRFDDTATLFNVNVAVNVAPGGITVTNQQNAYTWSSTNNNTVGGSGALSKKGTNSLTLAVNYISGGGITVSAGTLVIGDGNTNGAVTVSTIVNNGAVIFNRADINASYSTGISGTGSVTVDGLTNGILAYGGNNSYLGDTIVKSGTLNSGGSGCIPNVAGGGNLIVNDTGIMDVSGDLITCNGLFGTGTVNNSGPGVQPNANGLNFTVGANNTNSTFAGTLSNSVDRLNLVKTGTGTLFLTGTNVNTGTFQFNQGILNVATLSDYGVPSAIGARPLGEESAGNNRIGLWFRGGTLQYTGADPQFCNRAIRMFSTTSSIDASGANTNATLNFTYGAVNGANINLFENPGNRTLQLIGSNTGSNSFTIQLTDQATSPTSLTKAGAGTWYLNCPIGEYYSGLTAVNGGTLVLSTTHNSGSTPPVNLNGPGSATVADGATLGVINDAASISATVSNLTLGVSGATTARFQNVADTATPLINAIGTVTVNGTNTVVIGDTNALVAGSTYPLVKYGTLAGAGFGGIGLAPLPAGIYGKLTNDLGNSWIALVTSATPFSSVNTNPTNITATVSGSTLTLTWPADHTGWRLQAQTNSLSSGLGTNWVTIPGTDASNSYSATMDATKPTVFYRMVYP